MRRRGFASPKGEKRMDPRRARTLEEASAELNDHSTRSRAKIRVWPTV
jgi:hypothetical protein